MSQICFITQDGTEQQAFRFSIKVDSRSVSLKVSMRYRKKSSRWYMSVYDVVNQKDVVTNVPVLCSENLRNNLLNQFAYTGIGSCIVAAKSMENSGIDPGIDNITGYKIVWGD